MKLSAELKAMGQTLAEQLPKDILNSLAEASQRFVEGCKDQQSVTVGMRAPLFTLPDSHGEPVALADVLKKGPVVLSFFRGMWCPFCSLELIALQKALPNITALGATLLAVSPQTVEYSQETTRKHSLGFCVISDRRNAVAKKYKLMFTLPKVIRSVYGQLGADLSKFNGDDTYGLPIAATYVIDRNGMIRASFVNADYTQRMDPEDILAALRMLAR